MRFASTVPEQLKSNVDMRYRTGDEAFVAIRYARDLTPTRPQLALPAVQVSLCAGGLPEWERNEMCCLTIPLNVI